MSEAPKKTFTVIAYAECYVHIEASSAEEAIEISKRRDRRGELTANWNRTMNAPLEGHKIAPEAVELDRDQLKRLKAATSPYAKPAPGQDQDLVRLGMLDQDLQPTTAGLETLAREGINTFGEDQERRQDWHSDHDPEA